MKFARIVPVLVPAVALSACVANNPEGASEAQGAGDPIEVRITDDTCEVSSAEVPSGRVTFHLKNEGTVRNEFEILAEDRLRIVGERENLGPGTTTDYTVLLEPGSYVTACKKNMVGALVDARDFTVTQGEEVEVSADERELIDAAVTNYTAYVRDQVGQLLAATEDFADLYRNGDEQAARAAYAPSRMFFERIEPTAEAFGDLDPALDEREADYQASEEADTRPWTGWHRIEKDLWRPEGTPAAGTEERTDLAKQLVDDTQELYDLVYSADFSVSIADISNGAIGLLEEVATTKITGEEEAFSHTDLYDFQGNLEGARVAYGTVEALAKRNDEELAKTITSRFEALQEALNKHREGEGFVSYDSLDDKARRELSDRVDALRVPLATLTEAIV
ncbi:MULTISPECIES: iron uptake system protein EfeO [unclassified Corynebacterium]|uniref:iron uptake system protein EfeO n=1 Tax=unclassified Corynebacterium TaxID=2624378 RepID=UPI0029CA22DA|nr:MULTISPECIES: iron uptake system protein EfeO [unclassified Corynebacterium]WPF66535.1 peptidase M75 family protein [Corynebacterium sp. 22KM0430]WPF69024.1 peptidase M75 family protein [Corynebacterium sp. 21KM1197]